MKSKSYLSLFVLVGCVGVSCFPGAAQEKRPISEIKPQSASPAAPLPLSPDSVAISITAHLRLSNAQIERLNRLYDDYSERRMTQDVGLLRQTDELKQAQSSASFDERKATRLLAQISKSQQIIAADFLKTRGKSLKVLTAVQRSQLQSLANNERLVWEEDRYSQLLITPVEVVVGAPFESEQVPAQFRATNSSRSKPRRSAPGAGSYNVYAGYGYGRSQYGVYGNYGQGPVGVYGHVGRGGPSVGVSVGGVFGGIGGWLSPR